MGFFWQRILHARYRSQVAFKLRKQTPILHVQVHQVPGARIDGQRTTFVYLILFGVLSMAFAQDLSTTIQKQYSADGYTAPHIDELMVRSEMLIMLTSFGL